LGRDVEVATGGNDPSNDESDGYLRGVDENLGGDSAYLQEVCDELNFLGHLRAALVIAQKVRFVPDEQMSWRMPPKRAYECLPHIDEMIRKAFNDLGLREPSKAEVKKALDEYQMFTPAELVQLENDLVW